MGEEWAIHCPRCCSEAILLLNDNWLECDDCDLVFQVIIKEK